MAEPSPRTRDDGTEPRRVLIVRPSALGDVARTVPAAVSIKRKWPGCRLSWVVNRGFADAVRSHPDVDEVVPFDRDAGAGAFVGLMRRLRRQRFDVVYDLQGLARSGLLAWATRARRRVGFKDAREGGWLGCNVRHRVMRDAEKPVALPGGGAGVGGRVWAVDKMLGLLLADGVDPADDLRLYVGEEDTAWARAWRDEHGLEEKGYVVVAPTAKWGCKAWPAERYARVAARLLEEGKTGAVAVVCGPGERNEVRAKFEGAGGERGQGSGPGAGGPVLWPDTSVGRLMAVLAGAGLVVCNDSAALHLAVGLGVPTVSVFGPTDPALVGPWGYEVVSGAVGDRPGEVGTGGHAVLRAPGAEDGVVDYRRHRDDDTLIRGVGVADVWSAVSRNL